MKPQALPPINIPLMEPNGDVSLPWYMFFKNLNNAVFNKAEPEQLENS